ncbi:unnamed protein product [Schistosoma mattheei]|uniref:Uncharacterized protein n=1 Tax=Schistosoma mattheei TaxID=31246 RepID=A0A183NMM3_9TREM|nr:unnamed protein product [Schistosoma mattheei]
MLLGVQLVDSFHQFGNNSLMIVQSMLLSQMLM